jgi:putative transposase
MNGIWQNRSCFQRWISQMEKPRFTGEQIAPSLRRAEVRTPVAEVCRNMGIFESTYFAWKLLTGPLARTLFACTELSRSSQLKLPEAKVSYILAVPETVLLRPWDGAVQALWRESPAFLDRIHFEELQMAPDLVAIADAPKRPSTEPPALLMMQEHRGSERPVKRLDRLTL